MKTTQQVFNGNNLELLKQYPDNYFDAIVTDPPYGLGKEPNAEQMLQAWLTDGYLEVKGSGFMGKEWDAFVPQPIFWKEVFRTLKYGGHVVSFFGTRTYDWGVMAMRLAGFEVRDCIQWVYGSGFPKSHNIGKAIDKLEGNEREFVGESPYTNMDIKGKDGFMVNESTNRIRQTITKGNSEWEGWGSALKPANEPIVLARKPLEKGLSIAENVLKWGTGGINIDGCRIRTTENLNGGAYSKNKKSDGEWGSMHEFVGKKFEQPQGRFPANFIMTHHPECECSAEINGEEKIENWNCHEDCPIKIMDEQSGISKSIISMRGEGGGGDKVQQLNYRLNSERGHNDKGGASRFFYCAKASKKERNKGLDSFEKKQKPDNYIMPKLTCSQCGSKRVDSNNKLVCGCNGQTHYEEQNSIESKNNLGGGNKNIHPTVKPISLMRYLVRLITPANGIVLDPFNGSGTTGVACKLEGMNYVGMELDAEYCKIAQARIDNFTENDLEYEVEEEIQEQEENNNNSNETPKNQLNLF